MEVAGGADACARTLPLVFDALAVMRALVRQVALTARLKSHEAELGSVTRHTFVFVCAFDHCALSRIALVIGAALVFISHTGTRLSAVDGCRRVSRTAVTLGRRAQIRMRTPNSGTVTAVTRWIISAGLREAT